MLTIISRFYKLQCIGQMKEILVFDTAQVSTVAYAQR